MASPNGMCYEAGAHASADRGQVYILMPRLKTVSKLVDSLKNLSDTITITANMAGELSLGIITEHVKLNTRFKNLEHPWLGTCPRVRFEWLGARAVYALLQQTRSPQSMTLRSRVR